MMQQPFYSNLHCYRIIASMKQCGNLDDFIEEYLGPLIRYDVEKGGQLLHAQAIFGPVLLQARDGHRSIYCQTDAVSPFG
ncbi:hypothetical protein Q0F98_13300 [Paenibacillus amylolyticus]|nr:hypothetical protein Q0F98_13300 [Paenibacillus amylolyticus]